MKNARQRKIVPQGRAGLHPKAEPDSLVSYYAVFCWLGILWGRSYICMAALTAQEMQQLDKHQNGATLLTW